MHWPGPRHPVRLAVGVLLLGIASAAVTAMALGAATDWKAKFVPSQFGQYLLGPNLRVVRVARWSTGAVIVWEVTVDESLNTKVRSSFELGPRWLVDPRQPSSESPSEQVQVSYGWPSPSMSWDIPLDRSMSHRPRGGLAIDGLFHHVIPLRPAWPGLLISALAHAAIWAAVLLAPGPVLRWMRRGRGGCARCGYDVGDLPVCPECGREQPRLQPEEGSDRDVEKPA